MINDIDPVIERAEEKIKELKEERDKLYEKKLECTELSQVFEDMESTHKKGAGHAVMVPLFGGVALVPAVIKPGSHIFANLGSGLYSKTSSAGARTFLNCRISQIDEKIDEKTAMINSLIKGRNDVAELAKFSDEMKKEGIINICEDETTETIFSKNDDENDDETMEDVTAAAAVAANAAMGKDNDEMDSFFDSLIESENKWNEECKFKESMGITVTEKDAKMAAQEAYALANEVSSLNKKFDDVMKIEEKDDITEIVEKDDDVIEKNDNDVDMKKSNYEPMKFEPLPQRKSDDVLNDSIMEKEPDDFIAAQPPSDIAPYLRFPDPYDKYESKSDEIIENYAPGPAKRSVNGPPKIVKKKKN